MLIKFEVTQKHIDIYYLSKKTGLNLLGPINLALREHLKKPVKVGWSDYKDFNDKWRSSPPEFRDFYFDMDNLKPQKFEIEF